MVLHESTAVIMRKNPGFTLIELIVSVTIIAILVAIASVTYIYAQKLGRDGRRIADLRSIEGALELYYSKNKAYPTSSVPGLGWVNSVSSPGNWVYQSDTTYDAFKPGYMRSVPNDPINNSTYAYWYRPGVISSAAYKLMTRMELSNKLAKNDSDGGVCNGWYEIFTPGFQDLKADPANDSASVCNTP